MKKIWNVLLVVLTLSLCIVVSPINASAEKSEYYTYTVSNGKATITDCDTSISGDITIPSTLGGYPVTAIGREAFASCYNLTGVTIPSGITEIGSYAFYCCNHITSVTISASVTNIGDFAFYYCLSLDGIIVDESNPSYSSDQYGVLFNKSKKYLIQAPYTISGTYEIPDGVITVGSYSFRECKSLTNVTIPDSVTSIGNDAFRNCSSLTSITIPAGITSIKPHTFYDCSKLTSVTLPDGITTIGYSAFGSCDSLANVNIPDSVTSIGNSAFSYCDNLTSVQISDLDSWYNINFATKDSNPLVNGAKLYLNGELITEIVIPDEVTCIENNVFAGCSSITGVTIHDKVTSIGDSVFCGCSNLQSVTIPDSVTSIGKSAFYGCSNLTAVSIPDSITEIPENLFYNCTSLQSITLPDSVTGIGDNAFYNCTSLTGIWAGENNPSYSSDSYGVLFNKDKTTLLKVPDAISGTYQIPDGVTTIGEDAFAYCSNLTDIIIPDSVTNMEWNAFYRCNNLNSVHISSLSAWCKIDFSTHVSNPLYNIANLYLNGEMITDLIIPDDITVLNDNAFYNCIGLTSVNTGNGLISIGNRVFYNCTNLTDIIIGDSVTDIEWDAFDDCKNLENLTIGDGVTSIGSAAFYYYPKLTNVIIGDGVTNIAFQAFSYCYNLTNVTLGNSVTNIENNVFLDCTSLQSITIPDSVTSIAYEAFEGCTNLTSVAIGKGVTSIGKDAFRGCSNLTGVYISDVAAWCNINFEDFLSNPIYFAKNLYLNGELVTDLVIPDSVTNIPDELFRNCTSLTSVHIGSGVTSIGHFAFLECSNLVHVTMSDSVASIGYMAFHSGDLLHVIYTGTQEQWESISIDDRNVQLTHAKVLHFGNAEIFRADNCVNAGLYCTACDDFITRERAEDGSHNFDWTLVQSQTFTSDGLREASCSVCGHTAQETLPMLVGNVSRWNVALSDDFLIKFYLEISQCIESSGSINIRIGGSTYTYPISELEKTDEGLYIAKLSISASQMNESIYVTVIYGELQSENGPYTVREYADTILADENYSQYHTLVKEMLHYGAMAQTYFGYNTENLADAGITDAAQTPVPETTKTMSIAGEISGAQYYGATLVFRDRIAVRFYFTGDVTGCTFAANGNTYTPVAKDGMYYVEIADILPQDLDQQITLTVTDADGSVLAVTYGPMNYIVRMNQKGTEPLQNLLKALYNYHLAAKALSTTA